MSYRILEKLNLIAPIVLIVDNVARSIVNVRNSEDRLAERLVEIENEVEVIKLRLEEREDEDFIEKYDKEDVETRIENLGSENPEQGNLSQSIEELTIIFEEAQGVIDGTVENADEGIFLTKRLAELKLEQLNIEKVLQPQIRLFKKIARNKKGVAENLLENLKPLPSQIDIILDTIDLKIGELLLVPPLGPPVAKVLELIVDLIDFLILQPLILALELGNSLLSSINQIYTFDDEE